MHLIPHPAFPAPALQIFVGVGRVGDTVTFAYSLLGDVDGLCIRPPADPVRTDNLWKTTCFEAFVAGDGKAYAEFNFSPSSQWASYAFHCRRTGMRPLQLAQPPRITFDGANLIAEVRFDAASGARLGLSAVIEDQDGAKSYWALTHPAGPPDFHDPDCFIATLP